MQKHETGSTLEWIRIQEADFSVEEEVNRIKERSRRIGGIVTFLGTARDFSKGKDIERIDFEYYPGMAEKKLNEIRERALADYNIIEVSIVHRVGRIEIGDNIVLIVVAAQHRKDAFKACEWCIDELKRITPIWKREETNEGEVWVVEHP
jgi:molybdopterin synthase catalytic subunit